MYINLMLNRRKIPYSFFINIYFSFYLWIWIQSLVSLSLKQAPYLSLENPIEIENIPLYAVHTVAKIVAGPPSTVRFFVHAMEENENENGLSKDTFHEETCSNENENCSSSSSGGGGDGSGKKEKDKDTKTKENKPVIIPTIGSVVKTLLNHTKEIVGDTKDILPSDVQDTLESATHEVSEVLQKVINIDDLIESKQQQENIDDESEDITTWILRKGIDESKEGAALLLNWIEGIPLPFHLILFRIKYTVPVKKTSYLKNIVVTKPRYLRDQYVTKLLKWTRFDRLCPESIYKYIEPLLFVDRECDEKFEGFPEWCRQKPCGNDHYHTRNNPFSYAESDPGVDGKEPHCVLSFDPLQVGLNDKYELIDSDNQGGGKKKIISGPIEEKYEFEGLALDRSLLKDLPFVSEEFLDKLDMTLKCIPKSLFFFLIGTMLILNAEDIQDWAFSHYAFSIIIGILFVFLLFLYFIKKSEKKVRQSFPQADSIIVTAFALSSVAASFFIESLLMTCQKVMEFLSTHQYGRVAILISVTISCFLTYWFDWYSEELDESKAKGWYTYIFNGRLWIKASVYVLSLYCLSNVTPSPDYSTFLVLFIFLWDSIYYHLSWTIHYFTQDRTIYTTRMPLKKLDYGKDNKRSLQELRLKLERNPHLMKNLDKESYAKMKRFIEDGVHVRTDEEEIESWGKKALRFLFRFTILSIIILGSTYFLLSTYKEELEKIIY